MGEQWYSNKELFEKMNALNKELSEQISALRLEMQETRDIIRRYNGLRRDLGEIQERVIRIEAEQKGKSKLGEAIRNWGGWLFALITLIVLLMNQFS